MLHVFSMLMRVNTFKTVLTRDPWIDVLSNPIMNTLTHPRMAHTSPATGERCGGVTAIVQQQFHHLHVVLSTCLHTI